MPTPRFVVSLVVTALVTAVLVGSMTLARPARAEAGVPPTCRYFNANAKTWDEVAAWMGEQQAAGRRNFMSVGPAIAVCAW
jgi:hypothetical protein